MATFLINLSPHDMQLRLGEALAIYVDAMRYPRGTEDHRASMWMEHSKREGWRAVAAVDLPDGTGATPPPETIHDRACESIVEDRNAPARPREGLSSTPND